MDYINSLLFTPSVTQSLLLMMMTMAIGIFLAGKLRVGTFSLGVTWILFTGIVLSHFGMILEPHVASFAKDFGLILFVYSIGLQVGPSFFSSFGQGGLKLNMLAVGIVTLGVGCTLALQAITGEDMATMVGVLCGAVTNTPGLGAAQQAFTDMYHSANASIATGYAVAYPLGVVGILLSLVLLKVIFRVNYAKEERELPNKQDDNKQPVCVDLKLMNPAMEHHSIMEMQQTLDQDLIVSRIIREDGKEEVARGHSVLNVGDTIRVLTDKEHLNKLGLLGPMVEVTQKEIKEGPLVSLRIVVTKPELNGKKIGRLGIRDRYNINITRVTRAGVELLATPDLVLQLGDRLMVVGEKSDVQHVATIFGNEMKKLDAPNLLPVVLGIVLGVVAGTIPFAIPGLASPFKLGLAGGSLIVAILISRFGPYYKLVTFSTTSANMMLREIGISMFLAAVGLGAGGSFVETVMNGGYMWIGYGVVITMLPLLIMGFIAKKWCKVDYFSLMGLIAGSTTDPPALAYAVSVSPNNGNASVAYATVYPLTMFLRVMTAQLLILLCC